MRQPDFYKDKFGAKGHTGIRVVTKGDRKDESVIGCPQQWWKEKEIEQAILNQFELVDYGDEVYQWLSKVIYEDYQEREKELDQQLSHARKELTAVKKTISNLIRSAAETADPKLKEIYENEAKELSVRQDLLIEEIEIAEKNAASD